jgi:hypothetical protein
MTNLRLQSPIRGESKLPATILYLLMILIALFSIISLLNTTGFIKLAFSIIIIVIVYSLISAYFKREN